MTAFIGPRCGCGKSTYLRIFNRMNDSIENTRIEGEVEIDGTNIYKIKPNEVDSLCGMWVWYFKSPTFPEHLRKCGLRAACVNGITDKSVIDAQVEKTLHQAALWDEVKDKLKKSAFELSGGQQQRLCIAQTWQLNPLSCLWTNRHLRSTHSLLLK
ncbi:MAG: ATP-binding cassette domain-containing protein [Lewinellaceae bacterium]|nr:ATP-binding cassette domain-containing protein [Lewinellaceae bacterium]